MAMPSLSVLDMMRVAKTYEYELTEKECKTFRSRIYSINKDGIRKYRTMREGNILVVWRMK